MNAFRRSPSKRRSIPWVLRKGGQARSTGHRPAWPSGYSLVFSLQESVESLGGRVVEWPRRIVGASDDSVRMAKDWCSGGLWNGRQSQGRGAAGRT